jgi:hypothetical protein
MSAPRGRIPDLQLNKRQLDDLIAYTFSLRQK